MCGMGIALRSFGAEEFQRMQVFAMSEGETCPSRRSRGWKSAKRSRPMIGPPAKIPLRSQQNDQLIEESPAADVRATDALIEEGPAADVRAADELIEEGPAADLRAADKLIEESPAADLRAADALIEEGPAADVRATDMLIEESPAATLRPGDQLIEDVGTLPLAAAEAPQTNSSGDDEASQAADDENMAAFLAAADDDDFSQSEEEELRLDDADEGAPVELQSSNKQEKLRKLNAAQQLKVARTGELADRIAVERLYGKQVWDALLHNPRLSIPEVARIARKGTVPKPLLDYILENGGWIKADAVRRALLSNPKIGAESVLKLLRITPKHELKLIEKGTAYAPPVREAARKLLKQ